jgi:AcrR family transcriptional regulator
MNRAIEEPAAENRPAEPRWERRKEARPGELIAAALALFAERGYTATRLAEVAARAGVSKGTVYLYFSSKEELFKAVVREGLIATLSEVEHYVDQYQGSAADLLRTIGKRWWARTRETGIGAIPKIVFSEAGNFPEIAKFYHDEVIARVRQLQRKIVQRGIDAGEFRPVDVHYAAHMMSGPLVFLLFWQHSFARLFPAELDPEAFLEIQGDFLVRSLLRNSQLND